MKAELEIVSGYPTKTVEIESGRPVTVGRSKAADVQILHSVVSRLHCQIHHDGSTWILKDLDSSNGTWSGGQKLTGPRPLSDGEVFLLGKRIELRLNMGDQTRELPAATEGAAISNIDVLIGQEISGVRIAERVSGESPAYRLRAHQPSLNRQVLLHAFEESGVKSDDFKNKLLEEVRGVSRLLHPSILQIHDLIEHKGLLLVVTEHFPGKTLLEVLSQRRFVNVPDTLKISSQVADAMSHADDQDLVVNRLAPSDVLLDEDNQVKVEFFRPPLPTSVTVEELPYIAPEVVKAGVLRAGSARPSISERAPANRAGVYSLASIMYHMLAGISPHEGETTDQLLPKIMKNEPPSLRRVNLKVSPALARIVERAMSKDPTARHADFKEFRVDLQKIISPAI
jgi:serine/threonine protein kinase